MNKSKQSWEEFIDNFDVLSQKAPISGVVKLLDFASILEENEETQIASTSSSDQQLCKFCKAPSITCSTPKNKMTSQSETVGENSNDSISMASSLATTDSHFSIDSQATISYGEVIVPDTVKKEKKRRYRVIAECDLHVGTLCIWDSSEPLTREEILNMGCPHRSEAQSTVSSPVTDSDKTVPAKASPEEENYRTTISSQPPWPFRSIPKRSRRWRIPLDFPRLDNCFNRSISVF